MGTTSGESGDKEPGVSSFSDMIMAASAAAVAGNRRKTSSSGRVDMVSKIDLSVKLDEDSVDEDKEMESSEPEEDVSRGDDKMACVKDEDASSPQQSGHENGFRETTLELAVSQGMLHRSTTASERSTVEDLDTPPSSPARLSAPAANQLKNEVTRSF